jgi:hypothetical protein
MQKCWGIIAAVVAVSAVAQTPAHDDKADLVASDFRTLSRIASVADNMNDARQVMRAIVDSDIESLREKRPDDTYRWASLAREEASRVKDQKTIERAYTEKELREVTLTGTNIFRVEVSLPTKQSLIAKNNRVYLRNVIVDATGFDGKVLHHDIAVDAWINPGDAAGAALPEIAKTVKVTVELGIESGGKHAVADVALIQAKLTDDPASPHFPAVQRLLHIRDVLGQRDIDRALLKSTVDEALLAMPGELEKRAAEQTATAERRKQPSGTIAAGDASPDVLAALQEVSRLLGGTLQDQTDARTKLQALVDSLQPKTPQR